MTELNKYYGNDDPWYDIKYDEDSKSFVSKRNPKIKIEKITVMVDEHTDWSKNKEFEVLWINDKFYIPMEIFTQYDKYLNCSLCGDCYVPQYLYVFYYYGSKDDFLECSGKEAVV